MLLNECAQQMNTYFTTMSIILL